MRSWHPGRFAILMALVVTGPIIMSNTAAQPKRPLTIPLFTYAGLLRSLTVTIASTAYPFIFDTGGGETMITPQIASAIGCTPYGRAIGFRMSGERLAFEYCDHVLLRMGDVALTHDRVGVFDLKSILSAGVPPAHGVVSLRSFRDHAITIELAMGRITVETPDSLAVRTKRMIPITIRVGTGPTGGETTVYLAARVSGRLVWLLLDSGNGDPVLIAPHVADTARIAGSAGEILIEFDGLGSVSMPTKSQNMIYDGVLGAAFMQNWIFTFSLSSNRAWAAPAAGPKQ